MPPSLEPSRSAAATDTAIRRCDTEEYSAFADASVVAHPLTEGYVNFTTQGFSHERPTNVTAAGFARCHVVRRPSATNCCLILPVVDGVVGIMLVAIILLVHRVDIGRVTDAPGAAHPTAADTSVAIDA